MKLTSQQKKSRLRKKADKLLQEVGRKLYENRGCLVCGGKYSCLHHYTPKSVSNALRYDWNNLIPICAGCHFRHHSSNDPRIHDEIRKIKGQDWVDDLEWKRCNTKFEDSIRNYEKIIATLEALK
jgi:5-methylcytosine-specific restriction endonuclease McrA